jgi:hypothetical protein
MQEQSESTWDYPDLLARARANMAARASGAAPGGLPPSPPPPLGSGTQRNEGGARDDARAAGRGWQGVEEEKGEAHAAASEDLPPLGALALRAQTSLEGLSLMLTKTLSEETYASD